MKSDKTVRGVRGILHIYDTFDEKILAMVYDFTGQDIVVNKSIIFKT